MNVPEKALKRVQEDAVQELNELVQDGQHAVIERELRNALERLGEPSRFDVRDVIGFYTIGFDNTVTEDRKVVTTVNVRSIGSTPVKIAVFTVIAYLDQISGQAMFDVTDPKMLEFRFEYTALHWTQRAPDPNLPQIVSMGGWVARVRTGNLAPVIGDQILIDGHAYFVQGIDWNLVSMTNTEIDVFVGSYKHESKPN